MSAVDGAGSPHKRKRSRKHEREASPQPPTVKPKQLKQEIISPVPIKDEVSISDEEEVAKKVKLEYDGISKEEWKREDLDTLFNRITNVLPKNDQVKYQTQAEKVDWSAIEFGEYSAQHCKDKWLDITTKLRKFRTMTDLIGDAREWAKAPWNAFGKKKTKHPDMPKKPLTPYFRFFLEKRSKYSAAHPDLSMTELSKIVAGKFHALSEKKKKKYVDQYSREQEEFKVLMEKFRDEHPEHDEDMKHAKHVNGVGEGANRPHVSTKVPPAPKTTTAMQIFIDTKASEHMKKDPNVTRKQCYELYRVKWGSLSDSKKLKYINKAQEAFIKYEADMREYVEKHPEFIPKEVKTFLSKAEQKIKDRSEGKPDKPPVNGYGLFTSELLSTMKEIPCQQRMGEVSVRWKGVPDAVKDRYNKEAARKVEEYRENYVNYLDKLSPEDRAKTEEADGWNKHKKDKPASSPAKDGAAEAGGRSNKPVNAMFLWMDEKRMSYQEKYPEMSHTEITRHMAQAWNKLSDEKKEKYKEKEAKQKKLNAEQVKPPKESATKAKNIKFPGEPKKPPGSGYQLFSTELLVKLKDIKTNDRMREISKRWHAMSEKERLGYKDKRDKLHQKYLKELESFKKKLSAKDRQKYEEMQNDKKRKTSSKKATSTASVKSQEAPPTKSKKKSATVLEEDGKTEELSEFSSSDVEDSDDTEDDSDSSDESSDDDSSEYETDNEEGATGGATEQVNGVKDEEESSSGEDDSDSSEDEEEGDGEAAGGAAAEDGGQKESSSEAESSSAEESGEESEEEE